MAKTIVIPSLCIPRVYYKFDEAFIEQVFCHLFGTVRGRSCVERIDLINRQDRNTGEPFHVVFVHFVESGVTETKELKAFVERIEAGNEVKIEYSHPWFWKVRKNQAKRRGRAAGPRMLLSEEDVEEVKQHQKKYHEQRASAAAAEEPHTVSSETEKETQPEEGDQENA